MNYYLHFSYLVGRPLVKKYLPQRAAAWSAKVQAHEQSLLRYFKLLIWYSKFFIMTHNFILNIVNEFSFSYFSYIIFLRITPFLPNWFINVVSPIIGVPLIPFYFGTVIGVAPPSFVCIQAGTTLQQLTSRLYIHIYGCTYLNVYKLYYSNATRQ